MAEKNDKNTLIYQSFLVFLKDWQKSMGLNQSQAAKRLGFAQGTYNNLLNGKSGMSFSKMEEIADKLGLDWLEIFSEGRAILAGDMPSDEEPSTVQGVSADDLDSYDFLRVEFRDDMLLYAGEGGASEGTYDLSNSPVVVHRSNLALRSANKKNLIAFKVGGASMEPTIAKGGIVIVDKTQDQVSRIHDGDIYAFIRQDEDAWVKRLSKVKDCDRVLIESDNPLEKASTERVEDIRLIGRVVWSWREH